MVYDFVAPPATHHCTIMSAAYELRSCRSTGGFPFHPCCSTGKQMNVCCPHPCHRREAKGALLPTIVSPQGRTWGFASHPCFTAFASHLCCTARKQVGVCFSPKLYRRVCRRTRMGVCFTHLFTAGKQRDMSSYRAIWKHL